MKKTIKIISIVLLVIVLIAGWFVYKNWNSFEAIIHSMETTEDDTVKEMEKTKEELQSFLDNEEDITVRDLTEEEAKALSEGDLTEDEVIGILTGTASEPTKKPSSEKKTQETVLTPSNEQELSSEQKISRLIAKLYVQKSQYLNKLDTIEADVRAEYLADTTKWGSKKDAKQALLKKYLPKVASWEKTCDSTVYGILDEISAELKKMGKDESIAETMRQSYLEEKKLKKTYFINRYMD